MCMGCPLDFPTYIYNKKKSPEGLFEIYYDLELLRLREDLTLQMICSKSW